MKKAHYSKQNAKLKDDKAETEKELEVAAGGTVQLDHKLDEDIEAAFARQDKVDEEEESKAAIVYTHLGSE